MFLEISTFLRIQFFKKSHLWISPCNNIFIQVLFLFFWGSCDTVLCLCVCMRLSWLPLCSVTKQTLVEKTEKWAALWLMSNLVFIDKKRCSLSLISFCPMLQWQYSLFYSILFNLQPDLCQLPYLQSLKRCLMIMKYRETQRTHVSESAVPWLWCQLQTQPSCVCERSL